MGAGGGVGRTFRQSVGCFKSTYIFDGTSIVPTTCKRENLILAKTTIGHKYIISEPKGHGSGTNVLLSVIDFC